MILPYSIYIKKIIIIKKSQQASYLRRGLNTTTSCLVSQRAARCIYYYRAHIICLIQIKCCANVRSCHLLLSISFVVSLCIVVVTVDSTDVKCEKIYKDFSDCVLVLGESMDNYQENVTSERGVEAVCR